LSTKKPFQITIRHLIVPGHNTTVDNVIPIIQQTVHKGRLPSLDDFHVFIYDVIWEKPAYGGTNSVKLDQPFP